MVEIIGGDKRLMADGELKAPPLIESRRSPHRGHLPALLAALACAVVLFLYSPREHSFYPVCMFNRFTGLLCPGCGGLRAAHELLHGNVVAAFRHNPLFVASLPVLAAYLSRLAFRRRGAASASATSTRVVWCVVAAIVLFGILRNLPSLQRVGLFSLS
jgi:hypothetical protein